METSCKAHRSFTEGLFEIETLYIGGPAEIVMTWAPLSTGGQTVGDDCPRSSDQRLAQPRHERHVVLTTRCAPNHPPQLEQQRPLAGDLGMFSPQWPAEQQEVDIH
jgi:hypothetical protein